MKHCLWAMLCCVAMLFSAAQPSAPIEKSLLWRISGKGLQQPSYLYGTMHLPDERLFNFSDSLLLAIEKSDGFAIEVDPDEMMTVVMDQLVNNVKQSKLLRDVISRKAYKEYGPTLAKRLGKPMEEITVKDVVQEQNRWMYDAYTKGSMPTFVDAWLYETARKQGKWTGGIEDVADQAGLLEDVFNEQDLEFLTADYSTSGKETLKALIETYIKQDIESIEIITSSGSQDYKDKLLLRRNVKMARRMDSLSAVRSMVFAIGAAHLPGDSGVISLLRKKGFSVEPVFSTKTIAGKNYKYTAKTIPWKKVTDANGYYEVEMPGKSSLVKVYGYIEMQMNINLFTSSGYLVMALPASQDMSNPEAVMLQTARKLLENPKLKQGTLVQNSGFSGREYTSVQNGISRRAQIYSNGQMLYVAEGIFNKADGITSADASHFFNSVKWFAPKTIASKGLISFDCIMPGVAGAAPIALQPNTQFEKQFAEMGYNTRVHMGVDPKQGSVFMFIGKATENDMYIPNDSIYLDANRSNYKTKIVNADLDTLTQQNGTYSLEQKGPYLDDKLYFHGKSYIQGNRSYNFFVITPKTKEAIDAAADAVKTFRVVAPPATTWKTQTYQHFSTWVPDRFIPNPVKDDDEESTTTQTFAVNSRDTNSSYVFSVIRTPLDTTIWFADKAAYWEKQLQNIDLEWEDSVYKKEAFTRNGIDGYEIETRKKNAPWKANLYRYFIYGDTTYTLFTCVPLQDANNENVRRFFNDFRFAKATPVSTIFTSKSKQFIAKLSSADSATQASAYEGFYKANFAKSDIPMLREALLKHYDWDTGNSYYRPVQMRLSDALKTLNDSTLDAFLKPQYANANSRDVEEQTCLLAIINENHSTANQQFVVNQLQAIKEDEKILSQVIYTLDDSLELLKPVMPQVLQLLRKKNMQEEVITLLQSNIDTLDIVSIKELMPYEQEIVAYTRKTLATVSKETTDYYAYELFAPAIVLGHLKSATAMTILNEMLTSKNTSIQLQGVYGLLEAGQPIAENVLTTIAADRSLRTSLLDALKEKGKDALFPKKYRTQQAIAEASLYEYVTDDADPPTSMSLLTTKTVKVRNQMANVYIFKMQFGTGKNKRIHVGAVAFPATLTDLTMIPYSETVLWDEEYDAKKGDSTIKTLLETLQENTKEED